MRSSARGIERLEMRRILVIRSGSLKYLLPTLSHLRETFPESKIDVLTDPDISETLSQNPFVDEVILYCNLRTFFRHQLRQLWGQKYDLKVALFTGEDEGRYNKFKVLAHLLPPLHWMLVYDEKGDHFSWPTDLRKALAHLLPPLARPLVYDEKAWSYPWRLATWGTEAKWAVLITAKSVIFFLSLTFLLPLILIKNVFDFLLSLIHNRPAIQSKLSKEGEIRFRACGARAEIEGEIQEELKQLVEQRLHYSRQVFQRLEGKGVCFSPFLEIGTERGVRSLLLVHTTRADGFATDISFHSLESIPFWKERLGLSGSPTLVCCDAYELPFRSNAFPFVFCFQTLHHFPDPTPILKEIYRVLAPGGYFYFDEEPVKRFLCLNLFRTRRVKDFSLLERALADLGLLSYIAEAYWGSGVEAKWGIVENQSITLGQWEEMLAIFDSGGLEFDLPWGGYPIKDLLQGLVGSSSSERIIARLFGASLKGLYRAGKEGAHTLSGCQLTDLLGCPNCWSTRSAQGMRDRPSLALEGDSLRCLSCGKRFERKGGVWLLFSNEGEEVVRDLIAR